MKKIIILIRLVLLVSTAASAEVQVSDNLTYGFGGYVGNYTDVIAGLPLDFNLQGSFLVSSSSGVRSLAFTAGGGKDFFYQMMSLNALYTGNRSGTYLFDGLDAAFSVRPFMILTTFADIQLEIGYAYTNHTLTTIPKSTSSQSLRLGMGLGILQTINFAVSYSYYRYPDIPENLLAQISQYAYWSPALAGVVSVVSGFPAESVDAGYSQLFFEALNSYVNYSFLRYVTNDVMSSLTAGADYYVLENLSLGGSYSVSFSQGSASQYISVSTAINF